MTATTNANRTATASVDEAGVGNSFHNPQNAKRYAWLRSGGLFHHVIGVAGASGATGAEFDSLVDRGMAEVNDE